jgi:hypothetical protein
VKTCDAGQASTEDVNGKATEDAPKDEKPASDGNEPRSNKKESKQPQELSKDEKTATEKDKQREEKHPENVMEKGIIYFITRGRKGVQEPKSPQDLQRSFFIMRPLKPGAKITDKPQTIDDRYEAKNRLLAVPKKVWPRSSKERYLSFVEKPRATMERFKIEFFTEAAFDIKSTSERKDEPHVEMLGEGVYALSSTGSSSATTHHLSYMLTIPYEINEVQRDVGLKKKGSFIISAKNPKQSGQNNPGLAKGAEYPKEIYEEFGTRAWLPARPEHMDYENAQILLIGEDIDAIEPTEGEAKDDTKETALEELEKLEHEDEIRIEHLKGEDTIYLDLGVRAKDYPMKSTW